MPAPVSSPFPPDAPRYIAVTKEWRHAMTLFGRCNGTDWAVLMVIADHTWGWFPPRDSAELGIATFRLEMAQKEEAIRLALAKLTTKPSANGWGLVRVVHEATHKRGRVLALETDWMAWAWESESALERCSLAMTAYRTRSKSIVSDWTPDPNAVALACSLRDCCIGLVPEAEVPVMEPDNPVWRRWIQEFEKLLKKRRPELLGAMLRFVHGDEFWRSTIMGEAADLRFARSVDTIQAKLAAKHTKDQRRFQ